MCTEMHRVVDIRKSFGRCDALMEKLLGVVDDASTRLHWPPSSISHAAGRWDDGYDEPIAT
jgi:hypothetical protein